MKKRRLQRSLLHANQKPADSAEGKGILNNRKENRKKRSEESWKLT